MALSFARNTASDKDIIKKSKTVTQKTVIKGGGGNLASRITSMVEMANAKLAHHKDDYILIRTEDELSQYMKMATEKGECAIDTETTGLNPMLVDIVGICLYTPGCKAAYIPINHKSYVTNVRTQNQLDCDVVAPYISNYEGNWIFHNAKYDIRVLRHTMGVYITPYWDTMMGAYCIDEEESHKLKDLHLKYCESTDTESLTFGKLFEDIPFWFVPISTAYLYAAGDAIKTYELYEFQKTLLNRRVLSGPYNVFWNIEMPLITVVADMEDRGVCLDFKFAEELSDKYHTMRDEAETKAQHIISMYAEDITNYKMRNPNHKLSDPISLTSPTQLAILFYDILKLESPDKKAPRGTGNEILEEFARGKHKDLCEIILEIRRLEKLIGTYIDKMPEIALEDGRVHATYKQYGAKTGRFSSENPNLQNIPSHNKEIRKMFKAQDGYCLIGSDFSQQEVYMCAFLSKDEKMMDALKNGKDMYSTVASLSFHQPYDECKEFRPDGTTNPAGKERRTQAKSIVLGILYGRSVPSIAEQLNCSTNEAQKIYDSVLNAFPQLAEFIDNSQGMAKELGYVTTAWGRRRHLWDMQLPPYEYTYSDSSVSFDPLAFGQEASSEVPERLKQEYNEKFAKCRSWRDKEALKKELEYKGIKVKDNGAFIAQAERQCVNARVQGSSADVTKLAMIDIANDERMKELDFHLIIQVHDEVLGECPIENAKEAGERLSYLMRTAPTRLVDLPFKCDVERSLVWYGDSLEM